MKADKHLCWLYSASSVTSVVNVICISVVWVYWTRTLNTCRTSDTDYNGSNCGCILNGVWGEFSFKGGAISYCYFESISPIPVTIWSGILALYHGYRACCSFAPVRMTLITKDKVKSINTQLWPFGLIIFYTIMSAAILVLMFTATIVMLVGYLNTCRQYRKFIVSHLNANGALAKAVYERLPCEVSYDLMDYLQPDPVFLDARYRRGSWIIDSDFFLKMSMWSAFSTVLLYLTIFLINIKCCRTPRVRHILNTDL